MKQKIIDKNNPGSTLSQAQKENFRNSRKHTHTTAFDIKWMPKHNNKNYNEIFSDNTSKNTIFNKTS